MAQYADAIAPYNRGFVGRNSGAAAARIAPRCAANAPPAQYAHAIAPYKLQALRETGPARRHGFLPFTHQTNKLRLPVRAGLVKDVLDMRARCGP
jgi:hypothetical protein